MRVLCQDLRHRRPGEHSDQLWGATPCGQEVPQPHTCAEWPEARDEVGGGVQHGNQTSGCWQGQHQGRALCSRQNPPLQPSSRGSSCWCYLGTKVGATLEVSGHLSLCLGANYVLTFFLNCPLLRVTQDTPLSTRGPLASTQKESGVGFESVNQAHM